MVETINGTTSPLIRAINELDMKRNSS
jgi:hypothetical protein